MSRFRKGKSGSPFTQLYTWLLQSAAWRDLDPVARALYVELRMRFTGFNNGSIGLGVREASKDLNVSAATVSRAFQALIDHGFVRIASESTFDQKRLTREWLLTELPDDRTGHKASKDFMSWRPPTEPQATNVVRLRRAAA